MNVTRKFNINKNCRNSTKRVLTAVFYCQMLKFVNILKIITFLLVYVNISRIFTPQ